MNGSRTQKFIYDGRPAFRKFVRNASRLGFALTLALAVVLAGVPQAAWSAPAASQHSQPEIRTYVVRHGDTLSAIALRFGVSQDALMRANNIRNPNVVYVGQVLRIPDGHTIVPVPQPIHPPAQPSTYVVRQGDTLGTIAIRFNTTVHTLMQLNNIRNPNRIEVGQVLILPGQGGKDPVYPVYPIQPGKDHIQPPVKPVQPVHPPVKPPVVEPGKDPVYPVYPIQPGKDHIQPPVKPVHPVHPPVYPVYPIQPGKDHVQPPVKPVHPPVHKPEAPAKPSEFWTGNYYSGKYFDQLVDVRQDVEIRFNWYTGSPAGLPEDRFSIRWEKYEHFQAGWYRFYAIADDGVRVYVDGTLIIDGWHIQPATQYTADVHLSAGVRHLQVDYFEEANEAQIHVYYERLPGQPPVIKR